MREASAMNQSAQEPAPLPCSSRRAALKRGACACIGMGLDAAGLQRAWADEPSDLRPARGDRLVAVTADGTPRPLTTADVKLGAKPLHAYPYDPTQKVVRDGSRLNKVLLIRLDPAALDDATRARSADGVLAFSAVCTHEGCDVSEWVEADKALLCFCHFSRFDACRGGQVIAGPASRSLPALPLSLEGRELAVSAPFSASPGAKKTG
jgi:rieske iron-sulfur protein